mmetsp:Transcript_111179/g.321386  ORF Transcript_111179/g.321386 Transcript_111179/m.321386 type:complete len:234 (-) Transcript_111179:40-741(-)
MPWRRRRGRGGLRCGRGWRHGPHRRWRACHRHGCAMALRGRHLAEKGAADHGRHHKRRLRLRQGVGVPAECRALRLLPRAGPLGKASSAHECLAILTLAAFEAVSCAQVGPHHSDLLLERGVRNRPRRQRALEVLERALHLDGGLGVCGLQTLRAQLHLLYLLLHHPRCEDAAGIRLRHETVVVLLRTPKVLTGNVRRNAGSPMEEACERNDRDSRAMARLHCPKGVGHRNSL